MSAWLRSVTGRAHQPSLTTQTAKAAAPKRAVRWRALARAHRELRLGKPSNTSGLSEDRRPEVIGPTWHRNFAIDGAFRIPHSALRIKVDCRAETDTAQAALLIGVYSYYYLSESSRPAQFGRAIFYRRDTKSAKMAQKEFLLCALRVLCGLTGACELWL